MIEIKNLTKSFSTTLACNNLSVNIDNGIVGLIGENGAGKSTLFRLISNVIKQDTGTITIDGFANDTKDAKKILFFLPDDPYIKANQSIDGIASFYDAFYTLDKKKFYDYVKSFQLPLKGKVNNFSKGMRRQLFIALTLSIDCKYYLLDEAFDGLDPVILSKIKEEILKRKEDGKTIIIASHNINTLQQLTDRILLLSKGRLEKDGTIEDMASELIKYQIACKEDLQKEDLIKAGFKVLSLKKIGSITHIVVYSSSNFENYIKENYNPIIFEKIPLDSEEVVMLNMIAVKEKEL